MALITRDQILLTLQATDRAAATRQLAQTLSTGGQVADLEGFLGDVAQREQLMATGLPGGIAIPHARSPHVGEPGLAFGRSPRGIDWGAADGPAQLVFLVAVPEGGGSDHLALLAKLARKLMHPEFKQVLQTSTDADEVVELLISEVA